MATETLLPDADLSSQDVISLEQAGSDVHDRPHPGNGTSLALTSTTSPSHLPPLDTRVSSHPSDNSSPSSPVNPGIPPPPSNAAIEEIIARAQALAAQPGGPTGWDPRYHAGPPPMMPGGAHPGPNGPQFNAYGQPGQSQRPHGIPPPHPYLYSAYPPPQIHHPFSGPGSGHPGHHVAFNQGGQGQGVGMMGIVPGASGAPNAHALLRGPSGLGEDGIGGQYPGGMSYGNGVTPQLQGPSAHALNHKGSYGNGFGGFVTGFHPAAVGADGRVNLFIGNLPFRVRWQDVKDLFRRAGTVLRADVSLDPQTNRSRGYGSVLMGSREDGVKAIELFNGYNWQTRILEVRPDKLPPEYEPQPYIPPSSMNPSHGHAPHPHARSPFSEQAPSHPTYIESNASSIPSGSPHNAFTSPPTNNTSPYISGLSVDSTFGTSLSDAASPHPANKDIRTLDRTMSRSPFGPGRATPSPRFAGIDSARRTSNMGAALSNDSGAGLGRSSPGPGSHGSQDSGQRRGSDFSDGHSAGRSGDMSNRTLHVSNIPYQMQWQDLKDLFRTCGVVVRADIAAGTDNRSKGFGSVVFASEADAINALRRLDGFDHNGRTLRVRLERGPQPLVATQMMPFHERERIAYNGGVPPPSMLAPTAVNRPYNPVGLSGSRLPPQAIASAAGQHLSSIGQALAEGHGSEVRTTPDNGHGPSQVDYEESSSVGPIMDSTQHSTADPTSTPAKRSSAVDQRGPGMGAVGLNRPNAIRTGVPHPGRIVMPTYPTFGQTALSPLQSSRNLPPMTPSMPGFTFHAYPATPPLYPMSFMSPGLGPFSPVTMTPGSPLNFPTGGFNPFHSPAPGAPIGRQRYGQGYGHGPEQGMSAQGMFSGQGIPAASDHANIHARADAEYFPHVGNGGQEGSGTPKVPMAPLMDGDAEQFVVTPSKKANQANDSDMELMRGSLGSMAIAPPSTESLAPSGNGVDRDSRASFDLARPEGLSASIMLGKDRRASFGHVTRSADVDG